MVGNVVGGEENCPGGGGNVRVNMSERGMSRGDVLHSLAGKSAIQ